MELPQFSLMNEENNERESHKHKVEKIVLFLMVLAGKVSEAEIRSDRKARSTFLNGGILFVVFLFLVRVNYTKRRKNMLEFFIH